ncbi:hypothetical protein CBM2587_B90549 [Cupriavidus taiwanensis]|uniref:Uncharacterized protein n=1 Tax=Cupriavidus taiwanensis TaxID=164546 RepID=A0A975XHH3_9BURK|nr:hypothetical protein CBM2587_B90549 [Cupriavidus taiwanensis]
MLFRIFNIDDSHGSTPEKVQ